ncbi:MAG: transposase [Gammaproteobacteria bacterium]
MEVTVSYDELRKGRHSQRHQVYCVTTVTHDRHPLFADITAVRLLVHELRRLHENGDVSSLAWVIMPDHLLWLFQLNGSNDYCGRMNSTLPLSEVVKTLKARSALTINRYRCHSGSLWQRAYYDRAARKDEDIRHIARYIIANPLRAGLVENIGDYPHWDCIWITVSYEFYPAE